MAFHRKDMNDVVQVVEQVAGVNAGVNSVLWNFFGAIEAGTAQNRVYYVPVFYPQAAAGSQWKVVEATLNVLGSPNRHSGSFLSTGGDTPVAQWGSLADALAAVGTAIGEAYVPVITSAVDNVCG